MGAPIYKSIIAVTIYPNRKIAQFNLISHPLEHASTALAIPRQRPGRCWLGIDWETRAMNLYTWLPGMFALGLASMAVCLAFIYACERI